MPVRPTYPGVYVQEIPSGIRTISGVATSMAAFIGNFPRGLVNEAVQLYGLADFEREYGGLSAGSETSYAIQQFFLNGGTQCCVVRVAAVDDAAAAPPVVGATPANGMLVNGANNLAHYTAGRRIHNRSAANPGQWGNSLRIEVDYATRPAANANETDNLFNLTISLVRTDGDRTVTIASERFVNLNIFPGPDNALDAVNAGSTLVQLDRTGAGITALPALGTTNFRPAASGTTSAAYAAGASAPATGNVTVRVTASGVVTNLTSFNIPTVAGGTLTQWASLFQTALRAQSTQLPLAQQPYLAEATVEVIGQNTALNPARLLIRLGRSTRPFDPNALIEFTAAPAAFRLGAGTVASPQQIVPAGAGGLGVDGTVPVPVVSYRGARAAKTGMYALEEIDLFNILCVPDAAAMPPADMRAFYTEAEVYCEERRSMVLIDIPASVVRLDQMQSWLADNDSLRDANAAVYYPRAQVSDPLNRGRLRSFGASGTIAGLYARTDTQRGVWKAPAGTDARLVNVQSLDYVMTDLENGALNPLGVNCLRTFPVYSNICWGARTMDGADQMASDWKYVPVRRLTLFLEESLYRGTQWAVFEPNDEPLWAQIRLNVGAFMQDLFRKGAFQGSTPKDAYLVKCDAETTTQTDIDSGIVNVTVGFAPLKPAEFVILNIQQIAGRADA